METPENVNANQQQPIVSQSQRPRGRCRASTIMAVASIIAMRESMGFGGTYRSKQEPEEKPCLNCKKPKRHNNAFCSAECCREYQARSG